MLQITLPASFASDELKEKYGQICEKLDNYKDKLVDDNMVVEVLKIQDLVRELENVS